MMNLEKSFSEAFMTEPHGTGGGTCCSHAPCAKSELQATQRVGEALENPSLGEEIHVGILEEIDREVAYWDGDVVHLAGEIESEWIVFRSEQDLYFHFERVLGGKVLSTWKCAFHDASARARAAGAKWLIVVDMWGSELERWAV